MSGAFAGAFGKAGSEAASGFCFFRICRRCKRKKGADNQNTDRMPAGWQNFSQGHLRCPGEDTHFAMQSR